MPACAHAATETQTVILRQKPQDVLYHAVQRECMVLSFTLLLLLHYHDLLLLLPINASASASSFCIHGQ
jgi:hypothetical protein